MTRRTPIDQNKAHPPFLFVSWTSRYVASITKQPLITINETNYINYNTYISDYIFQLLNGDLQTV